MFLCNILPRRDVGVFVNWHDVRVSMGNVAAREKKPHSRNRVDSFHCLREPLTDLKDPIAYKNRQIIEVVIMRLRHDLRVPRSYRG